MKTINQLYFRAFIKACVDGDFSHVHKLLTERHSIHETSIDSKSLLSLACSAGDFNLAQVSLQIAF